MAARPSLLPFVEAAHIRDLQHRVAEGRALAADAASRDREQALERSRGELAAVEEGWRSAVERGLLSAEIMRGWIAEANSQIAVVAEAEADLHAATAESAARRADWDVAAARHRIAQDQAKRVTKAATRALEQRRDRDSMDDHLARWRSGRGA